MARVTPHGGRCCGARHIYGFETNDTLNVTSLEECVSEVPTGRMVEIILNQTQCRNNPKLLKRMSDFGFVLTGSFINNNHSSRLFVFHRCDKRKPLNDLPFKWEGQVIQPSIQGNLPSLYLVFNKLQLNQLARDFYTNNRGVTFRTGMRVRVHSPRSRRHGREFTIARLNSRLGYYEYSCIAEMYERQRSFAISINNLVPLDEPVPEKKVEKIEEKEFIPHRHTV